MHNISKFSSKRILGKKVLTEETFLADMSFMKKITTAAVTLALLLACCLSPVLAADAGSRENTPRKRNYSPSKEASETGFEDSSPESSLNGLSWTDPETGYRVLLEDDAALLTGEEADQLALEMQAVTAYGNAAFKSISYNSTSAARFADEYYHDQFGTSSGTLFLIDMDNREIYIFSDGSVYRTITTAYANTITDNVYRYASSGDYYLCASNAFEQILTLLSGRRIAQPMKYISNALLALILAALINYFIVRMASRTSKASSGEILGSISTRFSFTDPHRYLTRQSKVYNPPSSGGSHGGGGHGGGGHSGGGGGHSGGGGGHRF